MGFLADFFNSLLGRNKRLDAERQREQRMLAEYRLEESRLMVAREKARLAEDSQARSRELRIHRADLNAVRPVPIKPIDIKPMPSLVGRPKTIPIRPITKPLRPLRRP
jgi:hypothetical protein